MWLTQIPMGTLSPAETAVPATKNLWVPKIRSPTVTWRIAMLINLI